MLGRIETGLRRWRRRFSRSEWLARLLKLPFSAAEATAPGLVLIQIDGLSHGELEKALQRNEMPFLRCLIKREHYSVTHLYSGLPSTTPAMQAELFYGIKSAVPAFNFMQADSGQLVRMFEPDAAVNVEAKLTAAGGAPLLQGGSCYSDNFSGGASEPHYCPASLGWGPALRDTHPLVRLVFLASHAYSFIRTAVLVVLELLLALFDFGRGVVAGRDVWAELKFIPTRVLIVILLRELITIGVKIDIARGLPVIHLNFLGYDEQAHRRGPRSLFAHWTLKGIDDAIARIWRASHRSQRRHYDVWIYSDHGQQTVRSYEKVHGRDFSEAVTEVFSRYLGMTVGCRSSGRTGIQLQRILMLGGRRTQAFFARQLAAVKGQASKPQAESQSGQLTVAPLGPVAHLYYSLPLTALQLHNLASALVSEANVPVVLHKGAAGEIRVTSRAGEGSLAENPQLVFGDAHPFTALACRDLIALCEHADTGHLIALGYCPGLPPLSFAIENGAHGGTSIDETDAFALLPADIPLTPQEQPEGCSALRPLDLRRAAQDFLQRPRDATPGNVAQQRPRERKPAGRAVRIMTYNVHSCIGMDGKLSPERIARVIARYSPDIVALQELDVGRKRTRHLDQAHIIARHLQMECHFHAALQIEEEQYGNAILTHLPMRLHKSAALPGVAGNPRLEPRGALWVLIDAYGTELQVINTHLGLRKMERQNQAAALLGKEWLGSADEQSPVILCGDFNSGPQSRVWRDLHRHLPDAQVGLANHRPKNTFFSRLPSSRIDHVFADRRLAVMSVATPNTELVRLASDHLPLLVELAPRRH
jgi:endonuclease/exonuclease/phosphatase family metal-dependent hydrolase